MRNMVIAAVLLFGAAAQAGEGIRAHIANASQVGSARYSYLFWDVYDATLYAPEGQWNPDKPFALTLRYLLAIDGKDIAERSVEEMRKQGFTDEVKLAAWYSQMSEIFPNVTEGTELTGVYMPNEPTQFFHNGKKLGVIRDPQFAQWFFNIWLAENTSEPKLRAQLLRQ